MTSSNVLYLTNTNDPVPLTHAYHATASRTLSTSLPSTTGTAFASTSTDVDSAYCPQCLTSWDGSTAFSTAKGRCCKPLTSPLDGQEYGVGCVSCPECSAVLAFSVMSKDCWNPLSSALVGSDDEDANEDAYTHVCVYQCGYCHWDSSECDLYQTFDTRSGEESNTPSNKMKLATIQLQQKLSERLQMKDEVEYFEQVTKAWEKKMEIAEKQKRRMELIQGESSTGTGMNSGGIIYESIREEKKYGRGAWSMEALEEAMKQRREMMAQDVVEFLSVANHTQTFLTMEEEIILDKDSDKLNVHEPLQIAKQQTVSCSMAHVRPLPVPLSLRPRTVRRCVRELEAGRPGILVKPKVNPLEGDTSLRYGHGQWWKKDSSAIHSVPRVQMKQYLFNDSTNQYALLLKIKNPTLGPIRLRLHSNIGDSTTVQQFFKNVVIDSMTLQREHVHLLPSQTTDGDDNSGTEMITLEPAEDSFLGIGKTPSSTPIIDEWGKDDSMPQWSSAKENSWKVMNVDNDVAWVQFITRKVLSGDEICKAGEYMAVPMVLEIEISEDSWESSLIQQAKEVQEGDRDVVSFTFLPLWQK